MLVKKVGQAKLEFLKFGLVRTSLQIERLVTIVQMIVNRLVIIVVGLRRSGTLSGGLGVIWRFTQLLGLEHQICLFQVGLACFVLACFIDEP